MLICCQALRGTVNRGRVSVKYCLCIAIVAIVQGLRAPKSQHFLMIVCTWKDPKLTCDVTKHIVLRMYNPFCLSFVIVQNNKHNPTLWNVGIVWGCFGDKHWNAMRLGLPVFKGVIPLFSWRAFGVDINGIEKGHKTRRPGRLLIWFLKDTEGVKWPLGYSYSALEWSRGFKYN